MGKNTILTKINFTTPNDCPLSNLGGLWYQFLHKSYIFSAISVPLEVNVLLVFG